MNRTTVVFLALAILLAHTLALHQTPEGGFAAPYDRAHVAYRLGRQLVHEGSATWDSTHEGPAPYLSPLWIGVSAVAERLRLAPTRFAQGLGILLALWTVIALAQFSAERLAGLIAPVLFAAGGATAAAAASGTETPLAMALATTAFLAFERGWRPVLAVVLPLLAGTRPEGLALAVGITLLAWLDPPVTDEDDGAAGDVPPPFPRRPRLGGALACAWVIIGLWFLRRGLTHGVWVSPYAHALVAPEPGQWSLGGHYLLGYFTASATAPVLLLPVVLALFGRLRPSGRRALALFALWAAAVGFSGGDRLPFWNALAPAIPLALLSVQVAITGWLDRNPRQAPAAWGILVLTVLTSFLVSMTPGDLGPLRLGGALERWMRPGERLARDFPRPMGRAGLAAELADTEAMRAVGIFLRDNVDPEARIGTFWPGAVGYLSRRPVVDLLGRLPDVGSAPASIGSPRPSGADVRGWLGAPRVDLVRVVERELDYLVPSVPSVSAEADDSLSALLRRWLVRYDLHGDEPDRMRTIRAALRGYEVVSVPVPISSQRPRTPSPDPFLLLRRRALGQGARLELEQTDGQLVISARHVGHRQIVDLAVRLLDREGTSWSLAPTGRWVAGEPRRARTNLLLFATGSRPLRLMQAELPADLGRGLVTAHVYTPGIGEDSPLAEAGRPATLEVD